MKIAQINEIPELGFMSTYLACILIEMSRGKLFTNKLLLPGFQPLRLILLFVKNIHVLYHFKLVFILIYLSRTFVNIKHRIAIERSNRMRESWARFTVTTDLSRKIR